MTLIAIIEDDIQMQQLYNAMLKPQGYEVKSFYEPGTFKAAYNDGLRPDICLVDGRIPAVGDGVKLIQWIREQNDPVPCVYVSGTIKQDGALPLLKEIPHVSAQGKPVLPGDLFDTLENALKGQYNIQLWN